MTMSKFTYPPELTSYFGDDKKIEPKKLRNPLAVKWAHAVNCQQLLDEALSHDIDMIEADIVLGKLLNNGSVLPIVAHPPLTSSDLSLDSLLLQVKLFNLHNPDKIKGIKLDFKSIEAFETALGSLRCTIPKMNHPIWLNADIVKGPVNDVLIQPIDPKRFLAGCAKFEQVVISIGWTTQWSEYHIDSSYTRENMAAMLALIKENNIFDSKQSITFSLRAGIAANSKEILHEFIRSVEATNNCTITIWSAPFDYIDLEKLKQLILSFGSTKVYLDIPSDLKKQLNLSGLRLSTNLWRSFSVRSPLYFSLASVGIRSLILPRRTSRRSLVEPQLEQLSEEVEKLSDLTLPASPRKNSMESTDSTAEAASISAANASPPIEIPRNSQQSLTSTPILKSPISTSLDPYQNFKKLRSNTFISSFKSTFAALTGEKKKEKLNPKWSASLQSLQAIDNMVSYENMSFIDYDKFNGYKKHLERQLSQISLMEGNQEMQITQQPACHAITKTTSCTLSNAAITPVCSTTSNVLIAPQTVVRRRQRISSHNSSSRTLSEPHSASRRSFHLDTDYEHNLDKPRNVYRDSLDSRKLEILNSLSRSSFILDSDIIDVLDLDFASFGKRNIGGYRNNKPRNTRGIDVVDATQIKQVSE
uniref:Menorin-like domain-containing protein n=1 Tax=Glossina brevipalpis TaxID=37001 RepID=A0A1A9WRH6_9MUSC